jgi:hypothetical protein
LSNSFSCSAKNEEQEEEDNEDFKEPLLIDTNDSDIMKLDEESDYLQFMDIDE